MIIKKDYSTLNLKILKGLCKIYKIKIQKSKKQELINKINRRNYANKIIKFFRKVHYSDKIDYISMEPVKYPCFIFGVQNNYYYYNYISIINYIIKTGDVRDPMTRIEYSDDILLKLDKDIKTHLKTKFKSTYKIKKDKRYSLRIKRRQGIISSYELRINELLNLIKIAVDAGIMNWVLPGPICIDSVEYNTPAEYLRIIYNEVILIINSLSNIDSHLSNEYSNELNNLILL